MNRIFKLILYGLCCIILSCDNEEKITPLPEAVTIQISNKNLAASSVSLIATQPQRGLTSEWSVTSQNEYKGNFENVNDPLTSFSGDPFETYTLRWTIKNKADELHDEIDLVISEGFSVEEMVEAEISLARMIEVDIPTKDLLRLVGVEALVNAGAKIEDLLQAGVSIRTLLNLNISINDLLKAGVSISDLLNIGVTVEEIIEVVADIEELLKAGVNLSDLLRAGISVGQLLEIGISVEQLLRAGAEIKDLLSEGIDLPALVEAKALVGELRMNGFSDQELESYGLVGTLSDFEGNIYEWVKIGDQVWMAENLASTKYPDGTDIPRAKVYDDDEANLEDYGRLYWIGEATKACPAGWHLPSRDEYEELKNFLGANSSVKAKSTGTMQDNTGLWEKDNTKFEGSNLSGLNLIPGGTEYYEDGFPIYDSDKGGEYMNKGTRGYFATTYSDWGWIYFFVADFNDTELGFGAQDVATYKLLNSVRCIQN